MLIANHSSLYAKYWLYVSIESLDHATKSIEFYTADSAGADKSVFKCENVGGKARGMYMTDKVQDIGETQTLQSSISKNLFRYRVWLTSQVHFQYQA